MINNTLFYFRIIWFSFLIALSKMLYAAQVSPLLVEVNTAPNQSGEFQLEVQGTKPKGGVENLEIQFMTAEQDSTGKVNYIPVTKDDRIKKDKNNPLTWVSMAEKSFSIKGEEKKILKGKVTPPRGTNGYYFVAISVEPKVDVEKTPKQSMGVTVNIRYITLLKIKVKSSLSSVVRVKSKLDDFKVIRIGDDLFASIILDNTSNWLAAYNNELRLRAINTEHRSKLQLVEMKTPYAWGGNAITKVFPKAKVELVGYLGQVPDELKTEKNKDNKQNIRSNKVFNLGEYRIAVYSKVDNKIVASKRFDKKIDLSMVQAIQDKDQNFKKYKDVLEVLDKQKVDSK